MFISFKRNFNSFLFNDGGGQIKTSFTEDYIQQFQCQCNIFSKMYKYFFRKQVYDFFSIKYDLASGIFNLLILHLAIGWTFQGPTSGVTSSRNPRPIYTKSVSTN